MSDPRRAERVLDTLIEQVGHDDDYRECREHLAELRRKAGILDRLLYLCEPGIRPAGLGSGEKALILSLIAWIEGGEGR